MWAPEKTAQWELRNLQLCLGSAELVDPRGYRYPELRGAVIGGGPSVSGKRGARLERERRGQPADGCPIHAIGASDLSLRLAGRQPRQRLLTLERVELRLATELHAASLRTHPAGVCSILDEFALELRELPARDAD